VCRRDVYSLALQLALLGRVGLISISPEYLPEDEEKSAAPRYADCLTSHEQRAPDPGRQARMTVCLEAEWLHAAHIRLSAPGTSRSHKHR